MAIINTLITAKDKMSETINNLKTNISNAKKKIVSDFSGIGDSVQDIESSFAQFRNGSISSLGDIVSYFNKFKSTMGGVGDVASKFAIAGAIVAGVSVGVVAGMVSMVSSAADYVREMKEVSTATGVPVEQLQKLRAEFVSTGLQIDKLGDINKDVLDHLGDGFRDGSGPTDDMKALGLQVRDYNKYLNQADGGIKAVIHTFYQLRGAGKNMAEITNMMETLASDSSHMITTLDKYKNETEATNAIMAQHADITQETINKYAEWDTNVSQMQASLNAMKVNALLPVVETLNSFIENIKSGDWKKNSFSDFISWLLDTLRLPDWANNEATKFFDTMKKTLLNESWTGSGFKDELLATLDILKTPDWLNNEAVEFFKGYQKMVDKIKGIDTGDIFKSEDRETKIKVNQETTKTETTIPPKGEVTGGWVDPADEAKKAAAAAAAAKQLAEQKKQAAAWLSQLEASNADQTRKQDEQYAINLSKLDEYHKKSLVSEQQYKRGVELLNYQKQKSDIEGTFTRQIENVNSQHDQMLLSEEEYQTKLHDIKYNKQQALNDAAYYNEIGSLESKHTAGLASEEAYQQGLYEISQRYKYKRDALENEKKNVSEIDGYKKQTAELQKYTSSVDSGVAVFSSFADTVKTAAGEGTAAWYAATIAQKAMMVGQAIMHANLAASVAMSTTPGGIGPMLAAANTARMWGYANAAAIAAQGIVEIAGAREKGGPVRAGSTYLVGEKGPELFTTPGSGGQITSNNNLVKAISNSSGGDNETTNGGNTYLYKQYNTFNGSERGADDVEFLKTVTNSIFNARIREETQPGGSLAQRT